MDVVEVTDQIGSRARLTDRDLVEPPLRSPEPRDPLPLEGIPVVFEQNVGTDDGGFQARALRKSAPGLTISRQLPSTR